MKSEIVVCQIEWIPIHFAIPPLSENRNGTPVSRQILAKLHGGKIVVTERRASRDQVSGSWYATQSGAEPIEAPTHWTYLEDTFKTERE